MTAVNPSDPHGHHDWHSADYVADWIDRDVTRDDERVPVLRRMVGLIPWPDDADIRVLDVGVGYGLVAGLVLDRFPRATVVGLDFSEPMFAQARERLAAHADRLELVPGDLADPSWVDGLGGPFHAVVSALAIHNVRHPDRIRAIYTEIAGLVAPGGCFVQSDLLVPAPLDEQLAWLRSAGLERVTGFEEHDRTAVFGGFAPSA